MLPNKKAELDVVEQVLVKDVMRKPVITVEENTSAHRAAQLMERHKVGCVIVAGKQKKPLGIITERDLATRVVAKDLQPSRVSAKDVMTSPLITIDPNETLTEAARRMSRLNIGRLGVLPKRAGNLAGIIASKDILDVAPSLIEIIQEKARIQKESLVEDRAIEQTQMVGYCDHCGNWCDFLREIEGRFLCEECRTYLR